MDSNDRDFPGIGKKVGILGVPLGVGAGELGSELGVTAVRLADLSGRLLIDRIAELGYEVTDYGDVEVVKPNYTAEKSDKLKYLPEILAAFKNTIKSVKKILIEGKIPVIIGGDHSVGAATFSAVSSFYHEQGKDIGLIWLDAHADINTPETSPSGNIHGMPLAIILGRGNEELINLENFSPKLKPEYCAHIGARDLDLGEKQLIREMNLQKNFFTMCDIDRRGMFACVEEAIKIAEKAPGGYVVTFDIDVIDPRFAPGSGTLVRGGLTYREAQLAVEMIAEHGGMRSFEIVEVNPMLDEENITVNLAGELILSALGKSIL